jgi:integrase
MYPYKKARLNDCGKDLSKRWYIEFYAWDIQQNKLSRKRFYEVNNFPGLRDRMSYANRIIKQLNELLEEGYHFDVNKVPEKATKEPLQNLSLGEAVDRALEIKKPSIRTSSYPSYKSTVKIFKKWASVNRQLSVDVKYFDKLRAVYFDDYLFVEIGYAAKTVNGHIAYLKSLFQVLVEREIILKNPFRNVKKHKEGLSRKNLAFSAEQAEEIKKVIQQKDPQLWLFIQFIYYCYLRPNEVRQLRKSYFQLDKKQVFIPNYVSKNGQEGYVTIPDFFFKEIKKSDQFNKNQEFLFEGQYAGKPISKNVMGVRFHKLIKVLNLGKDYTLYSWKHSGVVSAYNAGVDIKTIQNQCRHHSLEQTDVYLKSLGLGVSQAINRIPEL